MNDLPFEIISNIFKYLDISVQMKFLCTCKTFMNMIHSYDDSSKINYKGIVFLKNFTHCRIHNNIHLYANKITQAVITFKCINFSKLDLPNLVILVLKSKKYISLENWTMPNLKKLDIVHCNNCVVDACHFPSLTHLYINSNRDLPMRFCYIPMNCQVIEIDASGYRIVMNISKIFEDEKICSKKLHPMDSHRIWNNRMRCPICCSQLPIYVNASHTYCEACSILMDLKPSQYYKLNKHPQCHTCENPLFVFMKKNGYACGFCQTCNTNNILDRLEAYAAKKINGEDEYPLE